MKLRNVLAGVAATVALAGVAVAQPQGMGPGMMFGHNNDAYAGLELTPEQQKSMAGIQEQTSKAMWQLMGTMHGQGYHMQGMFGPGPVDDVGARKSFQTMAETQKAMFEL